MGADPKKLANRARELHEFNPMLGFRGCRLAIAYPEIAEMQARAIFEAAVEAGRATGVPVVPEIMVPLIASKAEFDLVKERIDATAKTVGSETKSRIKYQVGTMIELPRSTAGRRDRRDGRVLFLRHQRPDADHLRYQPRRRGELFGHLYSEGHSCGRPLRVDRPRGRRGTRPYRHRARPQGAAKTQARHLRRARRRSRLGFILPRARAGLRVVLAVPRADRAISRRPSRAGPWRQFPSVSALRLAARPRQAGDQAIRTVATGALCLDSSCAGMSGTGAPIARIRLPRRRRSRRCAGADRRLYIF